MTFIRIRHLQVMTQEWYQTFAHAMSDELLFQVLTDANYMEIQPLLDLACLRVTFQLQGKSAEEVRLIAVFLKWDTHKIYVI